MKRLYLFLFSMIVGNKMKKIQVEAIAHYDRMIEWAKSRPPREHPNSDLMVNEIGEHWGGRYCVYCKEFFCAKCPLGACAFCCDGAHMRLCNTKTWKIWIERAEQVKQYIINNG